MISKAMWWLKWQYFYFNEDLIDTKIKHPHISLMMFCIAFMVLCGSCFVSQEVVWHHTSTKEPTCYVENFGSFNHRDGSANAKMINHKNRIINQSFKTNSKQTATAR